MPLLGVDEDLERRTLVRLPSAVHRLVYLGECSRRAPAVHWGMEILYGKEAATSAFSKAHEAVAQEIVTTEIRETGTAWLQNLPATRVPEEVKTLLQAEGLVPARLSKLEAKQLRLILDVLVEIASFDQSKAMK